MAENEIYDVARTIECFGATATWELLKRHYPVEYNMLLLASLEMQAKELEALKGNHG